MKNLMFLFLNFVLLSNISFAGERKKLTEETKSKLITVLDSNESLHAAFFKYEGKNVEKAAQSLKTKMKAIENAEIKKLLKFSIGKLDELKSDTERETNNQNYHLVSMALIHLVNTYDLGDAYNAYSCPMVKKKWVQNSKKMARVHNPYAPGMPHCGTQDSEH